MATTKQANRVKCLNTNGGKRFVFKTFRQRLEDIDIDVFRSLHPLKLEPSDGSSFFRDALLHWRELNTAEDFISFYEEMMPIVQTLPQILLHRERIFSALLHRLRMESRLSLEPTLGLIASLSRDLLEEFTPFLPRLVSSLVVLLESGGEHDPEVLEQVFTSWSYITMYLQKYLTNHHLTRMLKITVKLRYYPKDHVREFMGEVTSFLIRNAPALRKGIRRIIKEVARDPSAVRRNGAVALLWHTIRGTSSRLHSKAGEVIRFLVDNPILHSSGDDPGSGAVVAVICSVLQRLCEELGHAELNLAWNILLDAIRKEEASSVLILAQDAVTETLCTGGSLFVSRVLSILVSTLRHKRKGLSDCQVVIDLATSLVEKHIMCYGDVDSEDHLPELLNATLQLMLCLLDLPCVYDNSSVLLQVSLHWVPVFKLRSSCLVAFIIELLGKEINVLSAFRVHIFSAMDNLIDSCPEEVLYLMLTFYSREDIEQISDVPGDPSEVMFPRITSFLKGKLCWGCDLVNSIAAGRGNSFAEVHYSELVVLWGVLRCCYHYCDKNDDLSTVKDLIAALNEALDPETESIAGFPKSVWQGLLAAVLDLYRKLVVGTDVVGSGVIWFLQMAMRNKSSGQVLTSVAEFLDSALGSYSEAIAWKKLEVFDVEHAAEAVSIFSDNLTLADKAVRLATLRILSHYACLGSKQIPADERPHKKLTSESSSCTHGLQQRNVIRLLLSIESTPISVTTSRTIIISISRIEADLNASKICEAYVPLLSCGLIGIFHNRFSRLWVPTIKCFKVLIDKYKDLAWDRFVQDLGHYQSQFLCGGNTDLSDVKDLDQSDLGKCFSSFLTPDTDSTPGASVLSLLLQSLRKVCDVAESHSRQLIPLFLKFLGYCEDGSCSVEVFHTHRCSKKEWKSVLLEWLNLLALMRDCRSVYDNKFVKEVLSNRLLDERDSVIQLKVLECLLNWKDEFFVPYSEHLKNLIDPKNLRDELTTWSLSKDSHCIQETHRAYLMPLIIRMLVPKVRNLKTLASRKHAGLNHRKAILCFLTQLDVNELEFFFFILLKHLFSNCPDGAGLGSHNTAGIHGNMQSSMLVKCSSSINIDCLSLKKSIGFLYVLDDILRTFDELQLMPFLNPLLYIVARILERCCLSPGHIEHSNSSIDLGNKTARELDDVIADSLMTASKKQSKDLRSLCLKIISFLLDEYQDNHLNLEFWDIFFRSINPLLATFIQETASCKKPSSLLCCFVAMSRSPKLVPLLDRDANLLPSIFSILTVSRTSDAVVSSILMLIENLLNLDNELDEEETNSVKHVLGPHIEVIIACLKEHFQNRKQLKHKTICTPGKTEIRILSLLARYVDKPLTAQYFVEIMIALFKKKLLTPHECSEGLQVIRSVIPVMDRATVTEVIKLIQSFLVSAELSIRLIISDILDLLSANEPSLLFLAKIIRDLHAMSSSGLDEPDYDTRVGAYDKIKPELFCELREDHALVILSHCGYDMSSEDLIFRQCASSSLLSFIQFAAYVLHHESTTSLGSLSSGLPALESNNLVGFGNSGFWTRSSIVKIVKKFLLQNIGHAMRKETHIQREWMSILREMVFRLPGIAALNSLRPLYNEDPEADFFNNIFHLQTHKRVKALSQFKKVICDGKLSEELTVKIFVPLFFNMIFDVKEGKGEHLRNAFMEALACLCGQMQWGEYYRFFMRCLKEVSLKDEKRKLLLRLICMVLDQFHFSNIDSDFHEHDESSTDCSNCITSTQIQETLQKTILPRILKLITPDSEKIIVNENLVALKLLKLLSVDLMELHLPGILHHIANFLKSKLESVRDEARSALVACLKELGLDYLQFIMRLVSSILKRGYELHVLGYTLNFFLSKSLTHPKIGSLDYCLEDLLLIVENDILGGVAEEKEVGKISSKMKETRNRMSFDTLKLIAQNISFRTQAMKLLLLVNAHLQKHLTAKTKDKVVKMLHHIALGIKGNPSAEKEDVLIFVFGLIEDGGLTNRDKETSCKRDNDSGSLESVSIGSQYSHLIVVFGLEVLNNCLKNMKLDKEDKHLLSMLDPFIKLLANCLASKFEDILSATFKCLIPLSRLPLPSLDAYADDIKVSLIDILQKSLNPSSSLVQSCIKLLTVLLTRISLSNDQLHVLIQFPFFIDLQTSPSPMALSLLKQMVSCKLEAPELYDIVFRTAELMVTSQSEPIRRKCSHILLKFLLDYPLSEKCRLQHINFLLTNLSYEHASGRESVLEMLNTILLKFPKRVVDSHSQAFFLHLVLALANEKDSKIHSMILAVMKHLITCSSQNTLKHFANYSLAWYTSENQHLWGASAQVIGLLVEVSKDGFRGHANDILRVIKGILESSIVLTGKEVKIPDGIEVPFWEEAFYSLELFEKMLFQFSEFYKDNNLKSIWDAICTLLLHPDLKLRRICSHLVALYFTAATLDEKEVGLQISNIQRWFLLDPAQLFKIAVSFCIQLVPQATDDASSNLITQNIAYAICKLHSFAKMQKNVPPNKFWSLLHLNEKNSYLQAFDLLGSKKLKNSFLLFTTEEVNETSEYQNHFIDFQSLLVASLLKKMGKIALLKEENQLKVVFNSFRMIASQIGPEGCHEYAMNIVEPIYKVCEGFSGRHVSDEIKQFAEEVRDSIKNLLGANDFIQTYNTVRKKLKEKREKRRQEEKLMAIMNPARSAKRKLLKSAKHRAHKKRKILGPKMERWR